MKLNLSNGKIFPIFFITLIKTVLFRTLNFPIKKSFYFYKKEELNKVQ